MRGNPLFPFDNRGQQNPAQAPSKAAAGAARLAAARGETLRCSVCKSAFKKIMLPGGEMADGCGSCWAKKGKTGKLPQSFIPLTGGAPAGEAERVVVRRTGSLGALQAGRRHTSLPNGLDRLQEFAKQAEEEEEQKAAKKFGELRNKLPLRNALHSLVRQLKAEGLSEYELFQKMDKDGSGDLSKTELQLALRRFGCQLLPMELDAVLRAFDKDGNGQIDFGEFYAILKEFESDLPEAKVPPPSSDPRMHGFEAGDRVKSLVRIWSADLADREIDGVQSDEGMVLGAGDAPNTILVKWDRSGLQLNMKPSTIAKKGAPAEPTVKRGKLGLTKRASI
eukprot:gb/GFBE01083574.1/.p1 GENE.gb/GFBE01083574.1/~~gb/GFBE01083574.1/.p1  ORF type:complete len:336 (+),score=76.27 gb/GFBE01083574.1/:1-1008(+)